MSKGERQMLMAGGVALLLYYLFSKKPRWFTALYQTGGEATPTASDDFSDVGGSGFVATGTDGTGDLISDPNSDVTNDGGGVEESLVKTNRIFSYYDPAYGKKRNKNNFRSVGGGEADSDDAIITDAVYGPSGARNIAPVSVLR